MVDRHNVPRISRYKLVDIGIWIKDLNLKRNINIYKRSTRLLNSILFFLFIFIYLNYINYSNLIISSILNIKYNTIDDKK